MAMTAQPTLTFCSLFHKMHRSQAYSTLRRPTVKSREEPVRDVMFDALVLPPRCFGRAHLAAVVTGCRGDTSRAAMVARRQDEVLDQTRVQAVGFQSISCKEITPSLQIIYLT